MPIPFETLSILVIEDNPSDFYLLEQMLLASRLKIEKIYAADTLEKGIATLKEQPINFILLDLSLPDSFGIDSFLELRNEARMIPVIILTGVMDSEVALEALKHNAQDYLVKGEFHPDLLVKSIEYSIERKRAEEKILASEEKYRQIFDKNPFPMCICEDNTLRILEVNEAAIQKFGFERDQFLSFTLFDLGQYNNQTSSHSILEGKSWLYRKTNGQLKIFDYTCSPIPYLDKSAIQVQFNEITEKLKLEKELARQKQQMIKAVLDAQEHERKKIGEELHDNINQILTAVKLNMGLAIDFPIKSKELLEKCIENTALVIEEIRKLSKSLILPGNLKELGLAQSVYELAKEAVYLKNIDLKYDAKGIDEKTITQEQKLTLYRIVQEQLNNILKHAMASAICISLRSFKDKVTLLIEDNGKGFDATAQRQGVGITNIISRAELLKGTAEIISAPGKGCKLKIEFKSVPDKSECINERSGYCELL